MRFIKNTSRLGMTLIELMVAVIIMVLMMLAFGMIVTQAQKVVSVSENTIRSNSVADTIRRVVAWDFSNVALNGPLCITSTTTSDSRARFVIRYTTPPKRSKILDDKDAPPDSPDGLSCYGLLDAHYYDGIPLNSKIILCRQSWLAAGSFWPSENNVYHQGDVLNLNVSDIIETTPPPPPPTVTRTDINNYITNFLNEVIHEDRKIHLPPQTLADVDSMWEVLAPEANGLSVMWTDGSGSPNINWYGVGFNPANGSNGKNYVAWRNDPTSEPDPTSPDLTEYKIGGGGYRALWTTSNWAQRPKAIKISFRLLDPSIGKIKEGTYTTNAGNKQAYIQYEVICNLQ